MIKRVIKSGLVGLVLSIPFSQDINAEPTKTQKNLDVSQDYKGHFARLIDVAANLKFKINHDKYSSNLNILIPEETKPIYSLSANGKVKNNILYPKTFRLSQNVDFPFYAKKSTYTLEFRNNECVNVHKIDYLENKIESKKVCNKKRVVDYLTSFVQVMLNLKNGRKIPEMSIISPRGRISERSIKITNNGMENELLIPLGKKFFKTLEAKLSQDHVPKEIKLLGNLADLRFGL